MADNKKKNDQAQEPEVKEQEGAAQAAEAAAETPAEPTERVLAFRVEVPMSRKDEFIDTMKRLGFHGRLLREG